MAKNAREMKKQLAESQRKISNTDAALGAILGELARKCQSVKSTHEIDRLIRQIDEQMSQCADRRSTERRGRPARLLIGMIDGQEVRFPFFKERLTIGRARQNDIQLKAQFISRRHAVIYSDDDGARIVDWGSRNGISVNRLAVSDQRLHSGDRVLIGQSEFVFQERQKR